MGPWLECVVGVRVGGGATGRGPVLEGESQPCSARSVEVTVVWKRNAWPAATGGEASYVCMRSESQAAAVDGCCQVASCVNMGTNSGNSRSTRPRLPACQLSSAEVLRCELLRLGRRDE